MNTGNIKKIYSRYSSCDFINQMMMSIIVTRVRNDKFRNLIGQALEITIKFGIEFPQKKIYYL